MSALFGQPHAAPGAPLAASAESFTDGQRFSRGFGGALGIRNAPTIVNSAYLPFQFWDGRAASLEVQAISPIADPTEMNQPHDVSVSKLARNPAYTRLFLKVFGPGGVTIGRVEKTLTGFPAGVRANFALKRLTWTVMREGAIAGEVVPDIHGSGVAAEEKASTEILSLAARSVS